MNYLEFKNKWIGKRVDFDGVYGFQCVDLVKQYMHECYGLNPGAWGDAIDYWNKTNSTVLTKFDKSLTPNPPQGSIVIFYGNAGNVYGHIGIVDGITDASVNTLEQNGSTGGGSGTGGDAIRTRWISKSRVAGYLIPKGETMLEQDIKNFCGAVFGVTADAQDLSYAGKSWHDTMYYLAGKYQNRWRELIAERDKIIADTKQALVNEQAKPPKEIVKEVQVIVEKPVEVIKEVPVEVIKEVPAQVDEKQVVQNWLVRLWNSLFKR